MGDREPDDPRGNLVLERLLGRAGWTPENLGDHLNRLAASLGLKVHVNRRYPWDAAGAIAALGEVVDADTMERRHFMATTGLPLTAVAHQWLFDPARVAASVLGTRTDHAVVDDLERVAEARWRLDDALGGGILLPATREDLRLVVALLKNSSYTEEVGRRLYAVAAEFGWLAGWLAFETNQHALAQRYFMAALRAAHVSGARAVGANILPMPALRPSASSTPSTET